MESPEPGEASEYPSNRGHFIERIPSEILGLICDQSEEPLEDNTADETSESDRHFASHPVPLPEDEEELASLNIPSECHGWPDGQVPSNKHQRNVRILKMSHVCRSWRSELIGLKRIWTVIAFSADTRPMGVKMAMNFLDRIKDDGTRLHVYAGLPLDNVMTPLVQDLFSKLRDQSDRFETFIYWGRLGQYRSYLDRPTPNLRSFSDNHDLSHLYSSQARSFFGGSTPVLRSLATSMISDWDAASLTHLQRLDLWDCSPELSIKSLLSVLRETKRLVGINIVSPSFPLLDCSPDEVVDLPCLSNLRVQNPDFYEIIRRLLVPNVQVVHLYCGPIRGTDGSRPGYAFQLAHPFLGFARMDNQLPMLGQPIQIASIVRDSTLLESLTVKLTTERNTTLCVDLRSRGLEKDYIHRTISALAEMTFSSPSSLYIGTNWIPIDYGNPLFRLDAIGNLVIDGGGCPMAVAALVSDQDSSRLLPQLRRLYLVENELDGDTIMMIPGILRSRRDLTVVLDCDNRSLLFQLLDDACVIEEELTENIPAIGVYPMICVSLRPS